MKREENNFDDMIDDYLTDKLQGKDLEVFNNQLNSNNELADRLDFMEKTLLTVKHQKHFDDMKFLDDIKNEVFPTAPKSTLKKSSSLKPIMAIAMILLAGLLAWTWLSKDEGQISTEGKKAIFDDQLLKYPYKDLYPSPDLPEIAELFAPLYLATNLR